MTASTVVQIRGSMSRGGLRWALAFLVSFAGVVGLLVFAQANALLQHWSLIFIAMNFCLSASVLVLRVNSIDDLFSPSGVLSAFAVYFTAIAPALHIANDYYLYIRWDDDGRDWIGYWLAAQLLGFALIFSLAKFGPDPAVCTAHERPVSSLAIKILVAIFIASLLARLYQLHSFGGVGGIVEAYRGRLDVGVGSENAFTGKGAITLIADMSQSLGALLALLLVRGRPWAKKSWFLWVYLIGVFVFSLALGGLRGSRGITVLTLFLAVAYYHSLVRPVRLRLVAYGVVGLALFMIVGSWYKFGGIEAVVNPQARAEMVKDRHIGDEKLFVALRDFSRADVQAYSLKKYMSGDLPPSWGRSYVGGVLYLIPKALLPTKPPSFALEKTNMRYGEGYFSDRGYTTLVMGQFSEAIANFHVLGGAVFFLGMGLFLRAVRSRTRRDGFVTFADLIGPALCIAPVLILTTDSNILCAKFLQLFGPFIVAYFVSDSIERLSARTL